MKFGDDQLRVRVRVQRRLQQSLRQFTAKPVRSGSMTIREYIKRQLRKAMLTLVLPIVAFELIAHHLPNFSLNSFWVWVVMPLPFILLGLIIWSFYQLSAIVCPRCRTWLVVQAAAVCIGRPIRCCPHCRIGLDETVERLANIC